MQKKLYRVAMLATVSLLLTSCAAGGDSANGGGDDTGQGQIDVSNIKADDEVVALVPKAIKDRGVLRNGASTDYAPGEFRKEDGQTPTGYDIDLVRAMAKVMGLKEGRTTHAEFESLIPQIGNKFDIGASSFTVSKDRLQQVHMVAFLKVGFTYGVAKGNPKNFDPKDICGKIVGVQTGTAQHTAIEGFSKECVAKGKPAVQIKPHKLQTEVTQKVVGEQYDATLADDPVIGYAVKMTNGQLEKAGEPFMTAMHGIVVPKNNEQLAQAVLKALQKMQADGTLQKVLAEYGAEDAMLPKIELDPEVK